MMRKQDIFVGLIGLLLIIAGVFVLLPIGCGGGGSTEGSGTWNPGGSSSSSGSTVSGTVTDNTGAGVSSASCSLNSKSVDSRASYSATTNSSGAYSFSGVASGEYLMTVTRSGFVTLLVNISVSGNTSVPGVTTETEAAFQSFWGAAYDSTKGYLLTTITLSGSPLSGFTATASNTSIYAAKGYVNSSGTALDTSLTSSTSKGTAGFRAVTPSTSFSVSFSKSGTTIPSLTVTTTAGFITYYFGTASSSPSPSNSFFIE